MVQTEHLKDFRKPGDAGAPPGKPVGFHVVPSIERNAPVLPPLLEEWIALAHALGWGAAAPVQMEFVTIEEHVTGMPGNTNGDITHEFHTDGIGVRPQRPPLAETQPLHESEKSEAVVHRVGVALSEFVDVSAGLVRRAARLRPLIPC